MLDRAVRHCSRARRRWGAQCGGRGRCSVNARAIRRSARRSSRSLDVPIADRLLPDDEVVVVQRSLLSVESTALMTVQQALDELLMFTNCVVVLDMER